MADTVIDTTELIAEVQRTKGYNASLLALVAGIATRIQVKVAEALAADANADQASIDAADAAIASAVAELKEENDKLAAAVVANGEPGNPPEVPAVPEVPVDGPTGGTDPLVP